MKLFHKKFTKYTLVLLAVFAISVGKDVSLAQSTEGTTQIEESNPILDNSLYKIENRDFLVELGDKKNNNDDVVSFKAFPKKEVGSGLFSRLSNWATSQQKGLSFELIKVTDQTNVESEIDVLNQKYLQENDQSGVAAQVGGFFNGLINQFWNNVDDLANIGRKTNDLILEEDDNTTTVTNPILDKDISLEYQALENGVKENIVVDASKGEVFDSYLYKLNLDPGVILHRSQSDSPFGLPEGTYYFTDENNNYIAHFLPLVAYDSNGLETENVSMEILPVGAGLAPARERSQGEGDRKGSPLRYAIVITVDKNWLTDTSIQYPIKIDPSIVHDTQAEFDAGTLNRLQTTSTDRVELKHHELSANSSTVGLWHMNESTGQSVNDSSGNSNSGQLGSTSGSDTQDPTWNTTTQKFGASALTFDGTDDYVDFANNNTFQLNNEVTIETWVKDEGNNVFDIIDLTNTTRTKSNTNFQVVGDKIFYVYTENDTSNIEQIWTAYSNIDGTGFVSTQRTTSASRQLNPEMQVVGTKIYYVWNTQGATSEIWTASLNTDNTGWSASQRTSTANTELYPKLQVVGSKIHYAWIEYASSSDRQVVTASMNTDGTSYTATKRTTGFIAQNINMAVVNNVIYYVFNSTVSPYYQIYTATMNSDGTGWTTPVQRTTSSYSKYLPKIQVLSDKIYTAWYETEGSYSQIWTASMSLNGTNWTASKGTSDSTSKLYLQFQIVGDSCYYLWQDQSQNDVWFGEKKLSDTNITVTQLTSDTGIEFYPKMQMVGAKLYSTFVHNAGFGYNDQIGLGLYGSNIFSKSDAYGLGVRNGKLVGFINGGQNIAKYNAQDINYSNGVATVANFGNSWNHLAMTFEEATINIFLNGVNSGSYSSPQNIYLNNFKPIIGDHFNGSIDEIRVSSRALSPDEIKADAQFRPYGTYTSSVIDLGTSAPTWQNFSWNESGVRTASLENDLSTGNLEAQWNFNETSGTSATSGGSCGASCNGTLNNFSNTSSQDATPMSGWTYENRLEYGADGDGSLMFDGVDDYVSVADNSLLNPTGPFTVSTWFKAANISGQIIPPIIKKSSNSSGYSLEINNSTQNIAFWVYTASGWISSQTYKINTSDWYYVTGVYDGSYLRLYVNGSEISTPVAASNTIMSTNPLNIGRDPVNTTRFFSGVIESPKIYSRALSADEINSNYQAGNIEFQTRTGSDNTPEDGGWEEWKSTATVTENSVKNFDNTLSAIDPDPYTVLLLHGDNTNASQSFFDNSIEQNSIITYGNTQHSSTKLKFGQSSLYFDGFEDYLTLNNSSNWRQLGNTWTIDTWIYPTSWHTTYNTLYSWIPWGPNGEYFQIFLNGSGQVLVATNTELAQTWTGYSVALNQWSHIAIVSQNSSTSVYINGISAGTKTVTMPTYSAGTPKIGWDSVIDREFTGYLDDFRISKGIARWTTNFTPPKYAYNTGTNQISNKIDTVIKTEGVGSEKCMIGQIQPDANTVGLWHMEETGGSGAYIKDSSGNGNHGTPTGTTLVSGKSGKSRDFNSATNDQILISGLMGQPQNITLSAWANYQSIETSGGEIISLGDHVGMRYETNTINVFYYNGTGWAGISYNKAMVGTGWHHIAYVLDSVNDKQYLFLDGVLIFQNSFTSSISYTGLGSNTIIGRHGNGSTAVDFDGQIDEVKVSNVARTPEEIAEEYRLGANYHITRSLSSNLDLATTNNKLPIQIASDRPGTSLMLTAGESSYVNYELDTNTIGYWPLEENFGGNTNTMRECTDADPIGTACGGGKKFATGLVAMPSGCANSTSEPTCSGNDSQTKAYSSATGTNEPADSTTDGLTNTINLYNAATPANPAADFCYSLTKSGYSDWYLPAQTELTTLAAQSATIGGFVSSVYWSSSEYQTTPTLYSYYVIFPGGSSSYTTKTSAYYYRCIRQYNGSQYKIKDTGSLNLSGQAVGTDSTQGKIGKGRYFNGTSDYIRIEDPNSLLQSNSFTIEAWVKPEDVPTEQYTIAGKAGNDLVGNCGYGYGIVQHSGDPKTFSIAIDPSGCGNWQNLRGTTIPVPHNWYYVVGTYSNGDAKIYVNGVLENSATLNPLNTFPPYFLIGSVYSENQNLYQYFMKGTIDEVRYSNIVRTPNEIRQAYEAGLRSHPITIDFGAQLDSGNLITGSSDLSFTVDATKKGLPTKGENLFVGDKIIVKENYNGTEYLAQGTVTSVDKSTGAVTVAAWDSGSTFSSSGQTGYSANADVFKWQKEVVSIYKSLAGHRDAINKISLNILDGNQGQNVWLDDLKIATPLMTNPTTNAIQSTPNQYFQYRFFSHTTDTDPTPGVDDVELDYSTIEMTGASTSESYINTNNNTAFNIQCNGVTDSGAGDNVDCEASFNQTNWYVAGSATTPLSNQTVQGTPDISSWTGYPSGDGSVTIYARAHNTTNDTYSGIYNFNVNKDVSRPQVASITSVAGDTTLLYSDGTDNSSTQVVYIATADATACRWSTTDQAYTSMTNTCTSTSNCTLNLSGKGQKDVYMRCVDAATNYSDTSYHLTYYIDVDPDINSIDAGPSAIDRTSLTSDQWFNYAQTGSDDMISFVWNDPSSPSDDYFYYLENDTTANAFNPTGLVGWYNTENDNFSAYAKDHSGNSNDGTLYGTTILDGWDMGLARNFNGTTDYFSTPINFTNYADGITLSAWVKTTATGLQTVLYNGAGSSSNTGVSLYTQSDGRMSCVGNYGVVGSTNFGIFTPAINDGNYHLVTCTWDGTTGTSGAKIYLDGVLRNSATALSTISSSTYNYYIGAMVTPGPTVDLPWNGVLDEIKIVNRVWSQTDVTNEYLTKMTKNPFADSQTVTEGVKVKHVRPMNGVSSWGGEKMFIEKYDKTNPTISANNNSDIWRSANITITLSTADSASDLNYSKYSWDTDDATCRLSGTSFVNNDTINIISDGTHTLYLCNQDNAGNQNNWNGVYKLDTSDPDVVAIDAGPSSVDRTSLTSDNWFNYGNTGSDDMISYTWTDPLSPSDDYFYYLPTDSVTTAFNDNNLVGWWSFENDNTTTAFDHSSHDNHGTLDGTTITSGQLGNSRTFNGSSDYIATPLNFTNYAAGITLSAWVKTSNTGIQTVLFNGGGNSNNSGMSLYTKNTGEMSCVGNHGIFGQTNFELSTPSAINDGNWYLVSCTWDGTTDTDGAKLYINGENIASATALSTVSSSTYNYYIGSMWNTTAINIWNGQIDEPKIFNRVLSLTEIANEYQKRMTQNPYIDNQNVDEGIKYFHLKPLTGANNWGDEQYFIVKYDKSNPIVSADNSSDRWYGVSPTINLTSQDTLSSLNYSKYSWDTNDSTCRSSGTNFNNNDTINIISDGSHTLYLCNEDNAGNQGSWNGIYKLDSSTPDIVSVDAGPSSGDRTSLTSDSWFNYPQTGSDDQISFSWTDPSSQSDDYYYYLENDSSVPAITNDGLVGWWNFENDNTTTAFDHSGNGNDGTLNGVNITSGKLGNSRDFNGTSDNIDLNQSLTINSQLSFEAWINPSITGNYGSVFGGCNDPNNSCADRDYDALEIDITDSDKIRLFISYFRSLGDYNYCEYTTDDSVFIDSWTHIAAIYDRNDNNNARIFINGQSVSVSRICQGSSVDNIVINPSIGAVAYGNNLILGHHTFFSGKIDEIKIFNRLLSNSEIYNDYLLQLTLNPYLDNQSVTEGNYYKHIRPMTGADNWGAERQFIEKYDKTAPVINSITSVAGDLAAPYVDTTDDSNTSVVFLSSDNLNTVDQCKWSATDESYTSMPNTCTDSGNCTLNLAGDGAKTVYMRCRDDIGNEAGSSFTLNYTIDSTPPAVLSITSVAGDTSVPYKENTDDANTAVVYTASGDATACRWSETDQNYESMSNTCTDTNNCSLNLTGEGSHTVYMRCVDGAGLSSTSSYTLNYTIDTTPPTINSITSVAGDTAATYYDTTDDSSTEIIFDVSADVTECKWSATDQNYDSMPNTCSAPGNCVSNLAGQGSKTVFLRCKDDVENKMTTSTQVDYIIDSIAPSVLSITSVANDFIAPYLDTTIPYGQAPVVYVASADAVACRWSVNNVAYDSMANTCTSTTNCTITHSGDGGKSIFFRCVDAANNKSPNSYQLDFEVDENIGGGGIRAEETSSQPSDPTNFFITFTPDLTTPAAVNGSIRIRLDSEYDLSTLTHDDVYAAGGDVIWTDDELIYPDNNIIVFPFTGNLNNDDGQVSLTIANLQTINPGSTGSFFVSYNIFDNPAGTGTPLESGDGLVHLNYIVIVTASVPSFLDFSINPVDIGQTINGSVTNLATTSGQAVDFGVYTAGDDRIAAHDLVVSTNAASGYAVTIEYDQSLSTVGSFIPDFPATNSAPSDWVAPPGAGVEGYFGYTTADESLLNLPSNRFAGGKWAGFDTIPWEVIYENHTVHNQNTRVGYRLQLTDNQGFGVYSNQIMYIVTPTF